MASDMEARLRRLEDERAIVRLVSDYGPCLDEERRADYVELWTEDAELVWPGRDPVRGREAIVAAFDGHARPPGTAQPMHAVSNSRVDVDGDRAEAASYWIRFDGTGSAVVPLAYGSYRDELVRCADGRWRFARRTTTVSALARS